MLSSDSAILKLNKTTGSTIFSKTHNNGGIDGEHMALTPSGILAVGFIRAEDAENTFFPYAQGYITFLDAEGNRTNGQSVNSYMSHAYRIKPIGSDYIISGTTEDALQFAVIKINSSGGVLWHKTFGGINQIIVLHGRSNRRVIFTGHTISETVALDETVDTPVGNVTMKSAAISCGRKNGNPRGSDAHIMTKHGASKQL